MELEDAKFEYTKDKEALFYLESSIGANYEHHNCSTYEFSKNIIDKLKGFAPEEPNNIGLIGDVESMKVLISEIIQLYLGVMFRDIEKDN